MKNSIAEGKPKKIAEWMRMLNHTLERNVPGYKCRGIYQREIDGNTACAVQYTFYAQEYNRYTLLTAIEHEEEMCILNFVCNNELVPQMHPIFLEIIETLKFKEKR